MYLISPIFDYDPYGKLMRSYTTTPEGEKYLTTQHERDAETGLDYRGARFYDAEVGRFLSVDPLAIKYPSLNSFSYVGGMVTNLVDPNGKEPIKPQAGTAFGFVHTLNTTGSKMGLKRGAEASSALAEMGIVEWEGGRPMPQKTQRINNFDDKYIYTTKAGWLDMSHFMFYAGRAYQNKLNKASAQETLEFWNKNSDQLPGVAGVNAETAKVANQDPVAEAMQDGFMQEKTDLWFSTGSAYSYEDLPTDYVAAIFGANYFDPNSSLTFGEQLYSYLYSLGATFPTSAPNFFSLPMEEPDEKPSYVNYSTDPMFTTNK